MGACTTGLRGCCGHDMRIGEFEFTDSNQVLSITNKETNNEALVKHIRSTTSKPSVVLAVDPKTKLQQLEKVVHFAPLLRLKVFNLFIKLGN